MNKFFNRKTIINILFISAVSLLLLNLISDKLFSEEKITEKAELTSAEIDSVFRSALFNLGIHEDWIKKHKANPEKLSVQIPMDLPAVLILSELNNIFDTSAVKIKSVEKKIGGSTMISFISGEEEKLYADLIYNDKIKRKRVRIGFIVKGDGPDAETDSILLDYPEQFALLIHPSDASKNLVKKITSSGKEYIIYLNDEIKELEFKLDEDYSDHRLKNSVREIVGTFPGALFFMIDDRSSLYSSKVLPLLKDELEKRKIKLTEESRYNNLNITEGDNLTEQLNQTLNSLETGEDKLLIISSLNFLKLNNEFAKYRKLGFRFTNPSTLTNF
jgi:hypothetical protein